VQPHLAATRKRPARRRSPPKRVAQQPNDDSVPVASGAYLNCPFDLQFKRLFLAYIAGISAFGFVPRSAIEIPGGQPRLDRILDMIRACPYSIHDLSRVDGRLNMSLEVGMAASSSEPPAIWRQPTSTSTVQAARRSSGNYATRWWPRRGVPPCYRWRRFSKA
jgi:hypothetical protein